VEKRIAIAVGGTGGHVVPAQQIGASLNKEILYVGVGLEENRFFKKKGARYTSIDGGNFSKGLVKGGWKILRGLFQSIQLLKKEKISYVIGFGSFHSLPVLLAAVVMRIPFILVEFNTIPGKVNRFFSFFAKGTLIHFESLQKQLKGKTYLTNLAFKEIELTKDPKEFGLTSDLPIVLLFGGSGGAVAIDEIFLRSLQTNDPIQVIHITRNVEEAKKRYKELAISAYVEEFIWNIDAAWQVASFAICRSGAGSIRESILFEIPALFIPYPYATNDHQEHNARFIVDIVQGGRLLLQKDLNIERLRTEVAQMLNSKENILKKNALKEYKKIRSEKRMSELLIEIMSEGSYEAQIPSPLKY
jgi:UDP-N-acetylglucosamine--N-acetylmuramyl-(pentapeptide) pyrophosphoryl-undecaprenol N-acetylglucosamine transferase